jgi:uncharacterized membrane protein
MITHSIEIARTPAEVFAYVDELDRHGEWQELVQSVRVETDGPTRVGSRAVETRKVPSGTREITYEITEHDPPRRASFRGVDGPLRPNGTMTVEPVNDGSRSRVTLNLDLEGHGLAGIVLAPLARRMAKKEVPKAQEKLKQRLESGAA